MEIYIGIMPIFCEMPIAATAASPAAAVRLLSTVIPVTLSRFCIEAGIPTPQMPKTMFLLKLTFLGSMQTKVFLRLTISRTKK